MKIIYNLIICSGLITASAGAYAQNYATQADSSTAVLEEWENAKAEEQLENLKHQEKIAKKQERAARKELKTQRKALKAERKAQQARKRADRLGKRASRE